jgi:hypothetical protein
MTPRLQCAEAVPLALDQPAKQSDSLVYTAEAVQQRA